MVASVKFLSSVSSHLLPVLVVSGYSAVIRRICIEETLAEIGGYPERLTVKANKESLDKIKSFLWDDDYISPLKVLIVEQIDQSDPVRNEIIAYAKKPALGKFVIATSTKIYSNSAKKERWIATQKNIQHVDCNDLDPEKTASLLQHYGFSEDDALWLVDYTQNDLSELWRMVQISRIIPQPWPPDFNNILTGSTDLSFDTFSKYLLPIRANDWVLCDRLLTRLIQLSILSTLSLSRATPIYEIAKKINEPLFITTKLLKLSRQKKLLSWLKLAEKVSLAKDHASDPKNQVRSYLQAILEG